MATDIIMTIYCILRYTLNAEVAEYLTMCSGIKRKTEVFVPNTVKTVVNK